MSSELSEQQFDSLDKAIDCYTLGKFIRSHNNKRQRVDDVPTDTRPIAFIRFNAQVGKAKPITLKALLDGGGGGCSLAEEFAKKLKIRRSKPQQMWMTPSGSMTTTAKTKTQFTIPELHDGRLIEWDLHITKELGGV